MYMTKYPCVYMRGGTSKAVVFHKRDLPKDRSLWKEIFLKTMGSPDLKQIDGMGGAISTTSKIAVIYPSKLNDIDVNYEFFQVDIDKARIDEFSNCGNISSVVGPFAIDEKLVEAVEPITIVRVLNTNTNKVIEEHVRVKNGRSMVHGDEKISGVPGTGSRIDMYFEKPGGAVTGKLFPTGKKKEIFDIEDYGRIEVTVIDCANPVVFVQAQDLGIKGTELIQLNDNKTLMIHLERIRSMCAEKIGLVEKWQDASDLSKSIPKISIISKSADYLDLDGNKIEKENMTICCRAISAGILHKAYPMTVAIATGSAANIKGTLVHELNNSKEEVIIGHASGITKVDIKVKDEEIIKAGVTRTARRIMDGNIYIKH